MGLLLIVFSICPSVEAQVNGEDIVGQWIFNYQESSSLMSLETKDYVNANATLRDKLEEIFDQRKLTFYQDGSMDQELSTGDKATFQWVLTATNEIELTKPDGSKSAFTIDRLEDNTLVLKFKSEFTDAQARVVMPYWYLEKSLN